MVRKSVSVLQRKKGRKGGKGGLKPGKGTRESQLSSAGVLEACRTGKLPPQLLLHYALLLLLLLLLV